MRPLSCVCVRSATPASSSSRVLSHTRKRTFHVKHPTFAAYPRRSRALPRLRALAPAPPAGPARLTSHPRPRVPRIPASRPPGPASLRPPSLARLAPSCLARTPPAPRASLASPPLAGPERLTSRPLPRAPPLALARPPAGPALQASASELFAGCPAVPFRCAFDARTL